MRYIIGSASVLTALALIATTGGQETKKALDPLRVVILIDAKTKGIAAEADIKQIDTTGKAIGKRAVNEVRKPGTREELKRLEGIYVIQGAKVTLMDGKEVNCDLLLSVDVGQTRLRDVKLISTLDALSDGGRGKWYGYTAEVGPKK
ncbi:MAG TPA: hypothetical protein VEL76_26650 [Gemmataceae bacterium]|nr:hypothetical protein [Gemmataceae bacterium]